MLIIKHLLQVQLRQIQQLPPARRSTLRVYMVRMIYLLEANTLVELVGWIGRNFKIIMAFLYLITVSLEKALS